MDGANREFYSNDACRIFRTVKYAPEPEEESLYEAKTQRKAGGPGEVRTPDPLVANQVLSQLSYRPDV